MRAATLAALITLGLALPAQAYPTSVINVPTAGVTPFKTYHLGLYNYVQPSVVSSPNSPYSLVGSISGGVSPYFDLAPGVSGGAVEVGVDFLYPFPNYPDVANQPMPLQPHLKIGLLQETSTLPGIAIGGYFFSVPDFSASANVLHATATKWLTLGDLDLGQVTLGLYHGNQVALGPDYNGWMAGYYHNLPANIYVMGDYTSGATPVWNNNPVGGSNLAIGYSVNNKLSLTAGYYLSNTDRSQDKAFLFFDWIADLPM